MGQEIIIPKCIKLSGTVPSKRIVVGHRRRVYVILKVARMRKMRKMRNNGGCEIMKMRKKRGLRKNAQKTKVFLKNCARRRVAHRAIIFHRQKSAKNVVSPFAIHNAI